MDLVKVLFVCTGNICRSPTAQGIFTELVRQNNLQKYFVIDSAGTHAWCKGNAPDSFAQAAVQYRGINISHIHARKISLHDYDYFDMILAADRENQSFMFSECGVRNKHKIQLLMKYAPQFGISEIPDPYGAEMQGFIDTLEFVEQACAGLLMKLKAELASVRDR